MCADRIDRVSPSPISGFPEWSPAERLIEQDMLDRIRASFELFGFSPIETPAVERNSVLTAKGGEEAERQIYNLTGLHAQSGDERRDYSLHFDLTVPLARYVAQHNNELVFPFRRYQIQKVWRGERPQHGRFREFTQCDIDIVGDGKLSLMADAEIPAVISNVFNSLNIGDFTIRISNRKILTGYLEHLGFGAGDAAVVLREADKIDRQGTGPLLQALDNMPNGKAAADGILALVHTNGGAAEVLDRLKSFKGGDLYRQGVDELKAVFEHAAAFGIEEDNFSADIGIVRGLDYYTGTIYETRLDDHPHLGSICSGGRYDDLASYFIRKTLPGVGISIGLTRLFSQLLQAGIVKGGSASAAQVLVTTPDASLTATAIEIASALRAASVNTEIFFEQSRLGRQLRYASRKGFRLAVIPLPEDLEREQVKYRDMDAGDQYTVAITDLPKKVAVN
ncbi:MAG: histidine--tRNA ligase, partial [Chloroflexi bacterium]|nr:histidine--tRNA ligase [Chloroflexota bacterium]